MSSLRNALDAGRERMERRAPRAAAERGPQLNYPETFVLVLIDPASTAALGAGTNRYLYTALEAWVDASNVYSLKSGGRTFVFTNPSEGANTATAVHPGPINPTTDLPGTYAYVPLTGYGLIMATRGKDGNVAWLWVQGPSFINGTCTRG